MKMTLSLETLSGGAQPQGTGPVIDPGLAQLFAALLAESPVVATQKSGEITIKSADGAPDDGTSDDGDLPDIVDLASITGNILPFGGNVMPVALSKNAPETTSGSSQTLDGYSGKRAVSDASHVSLPIAKGGLPESSVAPQPGLVGIEWAKGMAAQPRSDSVQPNNAPAPSQRIEASVAPELAAGDASRLARLRGDSQQPVAQQGNPAVSALVVSVDPEAIDSRKPDSRSRFHTEQLAAPEQALRTFAQTTVVPVEHGARPVVEVAPSAHVRFELTKQIDKAVAALDAAPSDTVERAAKLTIPHERLGTMALHLSRDDDGGIGLRADTMPQDIRLHLAEGAAQAERRMATAPQPEHQGSPSGGQLGENTQGRGSNGEPRSSLEDRSGSQRDNTSARRDGQAEAQQRGRRQAPRDGGIFA